MNVTELSGGEYQRVAVGRALVHGPGLILADEPTGALDANTACVVMDQLVGAAKEAKRTLVIVTHDDQASMLADRCLKLENGRLAPVTD